MHTPYHKQLPLPFPPDVDSDLNNTDDDFLNDDTPLVCPVQKAGDEPCESCQ